MHSGTFDITGYPKREAVAEAEADAEEEEVNPLINSDA